MSQKAILSKRFLTKAQLRLREKVAAGNSVDPHDLKAGDVKRPRRLYGQEINPDTWAMAKMNAFIHNSSHAQ